jgi:MoaA/NifB/PqqE/SkfB family radical SAM enzyme/ubiquinone/menaquinone biosynthesis C-methylase UbiE
MRGDEFFELVAKEPPFSKMHPQVAAFFKDYLSNEKVMSFHDRSVLNTHFPPYPSRAFDNFAEHFSQIGEVSTRRLFSVTLGVTNRCNYNCWHCYNAGRSQEDIPLSAWKAVVTELQDLGVVRVALSGGEPLLREDLEEIVGSFDERTSLTLNTTGAGLTSERACALKEHGLFAVGVSLDSMKPKEHDRLRGKRGAFQTSLQALHLAAENGLYPYVIAVATQEFLLASSFRSFMRFASEAGALEVHLLEPSATGKLAGKSEVLLSEADRKLILRYQKEIAQDDNLPILSTFTYLESPEAFGCGAGLTHLYIDGSGEVCPCNLVPLSFGNITHQPLQGILSRMGRFFQRPRPGCVGRILSKHIASDRLPISPEASIEICEKYLPSLHSIPRFFQIRAAARGKVGKEELRSAYNQIHEHYDEFWLKEAAKPIRDLLEQLSLTGDERVSEAGCGTGFATVLIAEQLKKPANVVAVDLSEGMLAVARRRAHSRGINNIRFVAGDAIEILDAEGPFDIIFSSWVLGYIPLKAFFNLSSRTLTKHGKLAFIVHKENSPREPLQIFDELVTRDPSVLLKSVAFDFPRDMDHVTYELASTGLEVDHISEGSVIFRYDSPEGVLEHLLKSGAGTAFYEAIDPNRRKALEEQFLKRLATPKGPTKEYEVIHDYVSCIARKP